MVNMILVVLSCATTLYALHFAIIAIAGLLKKDKPDPPAEPQKKIAALVPARNEQQVIGFLIDSLIKQRYPRELFDVYVLVNNCTDDTAGVAGNAGAKVMICDREVHSKGEVLRYAFEKLLEDGAPEYDAFCIFDADNLVDGGFLQAVNNALCAGYGIAQGYRDSKNPGDNWVSGSTSTFFWFMSRLYNRSRANLGISASLNGTGIMISSELIREQGFNTATLTEDLEYTAQCALGGHKIGYMNDAVIYDEQPTRLKDSFTQRRRWGAGSLQCSRLYLKKLLVQAWKKKSMDCLDIGLLFMGMYVQAISCMPAVLTVAVCALAILHNPITGLQRAYTLLSVALAGGVLLGAAFVFLMAALEKKLTKVGLSTYLLMCIYMVVWIPANLMSLFTKAPKWTSIQHVSAIGIQACQEGEKAETSDAALTKRLRHFKETGA